MADIDWMAEVTKKAPAATGVDWMTEFEGGGQPETTDLPIRGAGAPPPGMFENAFTAARDTLVQGAGAGYEAIASIPGAVTDMWVGGPKEFDIPEVGQNIRVGDEIIPIQSDLALARGNPLAQAGIFAKQVPDTDVDFDAYGNHYVELRSPDGKPQNFYLNTPGASWADATQAVVDTTALFGGARLGAGWTGAGKMGLLGRAVGAGIGMGAASEGMDEIANILGSNEPPDRKRTLLIMALGLGGEFVGPVADKMIGTVSRFFTSVFNKGRLYINGKLTPEGVKVMEAAGIDPKAVTPEFAAAFDARVAGGITSENAAVLAEAESLPLAVRLSRGDVTRDPYLQGLEQDALMGAHGETARTLMTGYRAFQQQDLRANVPAIQQKLGGAETPMVAEPGQGAAAAMGRVKTLSDAAESRVDVAYAAARGSGTTMPGEAAVAFGRQARRGLVAEGFDVAAMPRVLRRLKEAGGILRRKGTAVIVDAMYLWRKRLVRDQKSVKASDPSEWAALQKLKKDFDSFMEASVDNALLIGDAEAVAMWTRAIEGRAAYGRMFGDNKIVKKLLEESVTQEQALNYLFGASKLGAKQDATLAIQQMKKLLGPESAEWGALKEEAFLRLLRSQGRTELNENLTAAFSGRAFKTAFDDAVRDAPTLMRTLYSPGELTLLRQFRDVAVRATDRRAGVVNTSNSATVLARIVQRLFGSGSQPLQIIVSRFAKPFTEAYRGFQAREATSFRPAPQALLPTGMAGGATGLAVPPERPPARRSLQETLLRGG